MPSTACVPGLLSILQCKKSSGEELLVEFYVLIVIEKIYFGCLTLNFFVCLFICYFCLKTKQNKNDLYAQKYMLEKGTIWNRVHLL